MLSIVMNKNVRAWVCVAGLAFVSACGGGDTSVETREVTEGEVPNRLQGVYTGRMTATARAGALKESLDEPITITVTEDNRIRFAGDDPDEVFETDIGANGNFNGELPVQSDECSGNLKVSGTVDGSTAAGEVGGDGKCRGIKVGVSGRFNATK